jgi:prepilin-type N-terminal cleavage/methylation domain-containing protein
MTNCKFKISKGFSLIELMVVTGIFATLIGISTISLVGAQRKSYLNAAVNVFIADLKSQQLRAMVGEEDGSGAAADYGIHFETGSYTQFRGSYGTTNFVSNLPGNTNVVTAFPSSQIVFEKGSGEISGFINGTNTVTFQDPGSGDQKVVTINKYGVVTEVN